MAETLSPNYGWTKPDPGASANTWGATLNATTDKIDTQVYVNQQGMSPIGAVTMFAGATAPPNWLICDGRSLSTAAPYDKLFAVLLYAFGGSGANFTLPDLRDAFPLGVSATRALGTKGGLATVTLDATMIPAHTHPVTVTDPKHSHTQTQTPHIHPDPGHAHGVTDPQHSHGGVVRQQGGWFSLAAQNPQISGGQSTDLAPTGISIQVNAAGLQAANANLSAISSQATGITAVATANTGGAAHNNMPPWQGFNFIVRYI